MGDKDVPHQSPGLTLVSDWGERGQIGKADVNAAYGGPLGRGPERRGMNGYHFFRELSEEC
ncbi:hypothetical protein R531_07445 [Salmonella enterica subsp. enterica serovar 6,7:-:1,5]|nr:hypothetical protein R531_07445 [Salmonella enterica subsp. enterica serovar 6,7:-:1,5]